LISGPFSLRSSGVILPSVQGGPRSSLLAERRDPRGFERRLVAAASTIAMISFSSAAMSVMKSSQIPQWPWPPL